jgi:frizzled protein 9/10
MMTLSVSTSSMLSVLIISCSVQVMGQVSSVAAAGGAAAPAVAASSVLSSGRCERITIPLCMNMKYNMTRMPNLVGLTNQKDAALQVHEFIPLIQFGCSRLLKFFLCSLYAPMCTEQVDETLVIPACRSMCLDVKSKCEPVLERFSFHWPAVLDCSKLPERSDRSQLCIDPPGPDQVDDLLFGSDEVVETISHNPEMVRLLAMLRGQSSTLQPPVGGLAGPPGSIDQQHAPGGSTVGHHQILTITDHGSVCAHRYVPLHQHTNETVATCAPRCHIDVLYRTDDKKFAELWMTLWSVVCFVTTSLTFVTFLINTSRFRYPERPVMMLSACSAIYSSAFILRLILGADIISCDSTGPNLVHGSLKSTCCVIVFILLYFFGMASCLWWVVLTLTFYLSAGRKWGREAIEACSNYYHIGVWSLTALKTILVLALRQFDADELTGICYVGYQDMTSLLVFVLVPLLVYLLVGIGFIGAGFLAMFHIRNNLLHSDAANIRKLEQLMAKIGIFSVLYTVPAICVISCFFYYRFHIDNWRRISMETSCKPHPSTSQVDCTLDSSIGTVEVQMLEVFMMLAGGTTTAMWICSRKTLNTWQQLFRCTNVHQLKSTKVVGGAVRTTLAPTTAASRDRYMASYRKCEGGGAGGVATLQSGMI